MLKIEQYPVGRLDDNFDFRHGVPEGRQWRARKCSAVASFFHDERRDRTPDAIEEAKRIASVRICYACHCTQMHVTVTGKPRVPGQSSVISAPATGVLVAQSSARPDSARAEHPHPTAAKIMNSAAGRPTMVRRFMRIHRRETADGCAMAPRYGSLFELWASLFTIHQWITRATIQNAPSHANRIRYSTPSLKSCPIIGATTLFDFSNQ